MYEYRWADGVQIKKSIEVSAPKYVEYFMEWIESQLDDESIFPQPKTWVHPNFKEVVKTIFKRLFRVYARPYLPLSLSEDCEPERGSSFKYLLQELYTFHLFEFGLIDKKELAPLQE
ncbi:MOB kinase activator 1A [Orobanche minor]